jgi:Trk K+ transport system NAD-binding subunit
VDDALLNVARTVIQAGSPLEGCTIAQVEKELDITIILHRGSESLDLHPAPDVTLHAGDCLVVFASLDALAGVREMSGDQGGTFQREYDSPRRRPWLARLLSREKSAHR